MKRLLLFQDKKVKIRPLLLMRVGGGQGVCAFLTE